MNPDSPSRLAAGTQLGPYEIESILGAGGMGEVYRARDTRLGREAAIKVLTRGRARDPEALVRFQQEARAASALNHPNIVTIYDLGELPFGQDTMAYIAMELVEGVSLARTIREGPLPLQHLLHIAVQTAEALAAAHAKGIVHRDLKPDNIMVSGASSAHPGLAVPRGEGKAGRQPGAGPPCMTPEIGSIESAVPAPSALPWIAEGPGGTRLASCFPPRGFRAR